MSDKAKRLKEHIRRLEYELSSYDRAVEVGSRDAAMDALARAGSHAAIVLALRSLSKQGKLDG